MKNEAKRVVRILLIFILIVNMLLSISFATEQPSETETTETSNSKEATSTTETAEAAENSKEVVVEENKIFYVKAKVIEAGETTKKTVGDIEDTVQSVKIEILDGEYETKEFTTDFILSYDIEGKILAYELKKGDTVTVQLSVDANGNVSPSIEGIVRSNYIYIMVAIFLLSIILVGGKKGIKAIVGLIITILAVWFILIKLIFVGYDAILMSIATCAVIIVLTFIVIGGINKKVVTAAIGTLGGVVSAGIVASIFSHLAELSGACEDAIQLSMNMQTATFNFRDLIFAGIVISALGACMDVGMSIASSLDEIKNKTKDISWKELFKSGMNIGRDVIGTMTNTLILAYVGGALKLILLFMACNMPITEILNKETIVEEIISAIAGSMGVVYTIPITAFVYAFLNRKKTIYKTTSENLIDGKRSLKIN